MKILTDDPDWAPDIYEARALAMTCVRKHGRASDPGCLQTICSGLTITYHLNRSPVLLTIDAPYRVLALEWSQRDAWRMVIQAYHQGRWQSRLRAIAAAPARRMP